MTRTRWMAALAAALLLGGAARAQAPCPAAAYYPGDDAAQSARVPYYYELTQSVLPACPFAGANALTGYGVCQASCETGSRRHSRTSAHDRHMASELLKLYRFYYRSGHYHAAEAVADRALQLDPHNVAAEAALAVARLATHAQAHAAHEGCEAEACESAQAPAPTCGMCPNCGTAAKSCQECKGCCQKSAKSGCGSCGSKSCCCEENCTCAKSACAKKGACAASSCCCAKSTCACAKSSCACAKSTCACAEKKCECCKTSCACGAKCCCKDGGCACGAACACKKAARPQVLRIRLSMPPMMMMCPGCPAMQAVMPNPVVGMMPHPPVPGMMPPPVPSMMPHPPVPVMHPGAPTWCPVPQACPAEQPERLPMPEPGGAQDVTTETSSAPAEPRHGPIQVSVCKGQVRLSCPTLEASCDTITSLPDGRALLDGDVTVIFHGDERPAKILARRMIVDLDDGSYEVNPARVEVPNVQPVRHEEIMLGGEKKKPTCSEVVPGCCPDSGTVYTPCTRDR